MPIIGALQSQLDDWFSEKELKKGKSEFGLSRCSLLSGTGTCDGESII